MNNELDSAAAFKQHMETRDSALVHNDKLRSEFLSAELVKPTGAKCMKCGAKLLEGRVMIDPDGKSRLDPAGTHIKTKCENNHFVGYRPAEPEPKKKA